MKSFAAIDFETANHIRSSVCSVGVVIVENGTITDRIYSLIKPNPNFYSYWNTEIHGIDYWDTIESHLFPEVWKGVAQRISNLPLVAHNSPFDKSCLKEAHKLYEMPYPEYQFYCTYRTAKKAFPDLINHQLDTVSSYIGYELLDHHNALADAEACARIAMEIL